MAGGDSSGKGSTSAPDAPTITVDANRGSGAAGAKAQSTGGDTLPHVLGALSAEPDTLARYRLGGLLGRGGMGEVVSARDEQIGRAVAIKRLRKQDPSPGLVERFVREACIQGRLEHPAIVPVHELSHDDRGQPFFVMKQLAGTTLGDVLSRLAHGDRGTADDYPRQRLLRAFADVCLAIEFAHTRQVVHRDLKPANIQLGDFGEVYVLDWGIARVAHDDGDAAFADVEASGDGTNAGQVLGTPGYMSPEQLRGADDLDGRSDVYSLGSILFEMLALQPLHARPTAVPSTLAGADARASVRAPERDVPPELDAICVRATALERGDRFATARELGAAVQRFLDGDRDLALRKQLAQTELAAARAAVARGNRAADRSEAMRAAGRALALDPTSGAAELVARLMIEPPDEVPPDVEVKLADADADALFAHRRLTVAVMGAYLSFWPILWWAGLRPSWFIVGGGAVCVATAASVWFVPRERVQYVAWLSLAGNLAMLFLFGRLVGPFTAAPGLAAIFAMTIGSHPRIARGPVLAAAICAAVLLPWLLGELGVEPETTSIYGASLVFHTSAVELDRLGANIGLALYVVLLVGMSVFLTRLATGHRRAAQRAMQIQAWQLQQLVAPA
jgi:serine/threonine-protein kinase|nr:serine/threonine-protein kinase [Kofleriaceae bacterium]